jgi:F-type H+-transporting ATPase subunit epsilon
MKPYALLLQDATTVQRIDGVHAFSARDRSGSFTIWAGHAPLMTVLDFGLARFRCTDDTWRYLALPGGVLYFRDDTLTLSARRFYHSDDYATIEASLAERLRVEEDALHCTRTSLRRMEEEVLKRLYETAKW